ncbi:MULTISPECIES: hypothetical protein [Halomonadaceae]|uniref:hypothetical protein n=1 Tax=Halomonadaceae TaxID=28256 RepID=UPI001583E064|nr:MULTISPECIES: hypothetical protein [Halomonas]MDI4636772.1 hypothetical protein [Halomonas sp. BMC7]NUJ61134.1 hypothetical protein [Halomonas taeanensis]|tara:strand:- start:6015 stop:6383 length:369 start_codon:yes stop_codon:yes gene_type:complete
MTKQAENITQLPLAVREVSDPVINWWLNHWMGAASPFSRMQVAWMETLFDAMQLEAELLTACATSQQQLIKCMSDQQILKDPVVVGSCYQDVMQDFINAHLHRMDKVNEMAEDFRQRVWEEI